jgi:hypothetical protein
VLVCAAACLSACALPGSSQAPTPSQVLATRLAAFAAAKTVTMVGHVSYGDVNYPVSLQVDDQGQASGTVELEHVVVSAMIAGGRTFLKNSNYYTIQQLATGDQWVLERSGVVVDLLAKLVDRKGLAAALRAAAGSSVGQVPSPDVSGVKVFRLANPDFSATVPTAGGPPVRLVTGVDTPLSNGFTDVRLTLSDYGLAANIAAPGAFLDRTQPDTWPAHFAAVIAPDTPFSFDACDASGCTLSASFKNTGGKVGAAIATFYVSAAGSTVGSCNVTIPTTGNGSVVRAGCRVAYNRDQQASGNVKIQNPQ